MPETITAPDPAELDLVDVDPAELPPDVSTDQGTDGGEHPDTFTREYVQQLRAESAEHRRKAADAAAQSDAVRRELWRARVEALSLLADPTDLEYDADALDDSDRIRELADALLTDKPHLRSRKITGRAGQGEGSPTAAPSLVGILRAHA